MRRDTPCVLFLEYNSSFVFILYKKELSALKFSHGDKSIIFRPKSVASLLPLIAADALRASSLLAARAPKELV